MGTATRAGIHAPRTRGASASAHSDARGGWRRQRHALAPYWFLLPYFLVFAAFWCWPIIDSALLSLQNTRVNPWAWNLAINWRRLWVDRAFHAALGNTLTIMAIQVPVMLTLATALAVALNSPLLKLRPIYRFAFFAPVVVSDAAYSAVFRVLFNGQFGAVNHAFTALGLPTIDWLQDPNAMLSTVMVAMTWRWTGYNAIILLAGLQSIPRDLYEAAAIDGATPLDRFFRITLPLLKPILVFCLVLSVIGTTQLFTEPWLITDRGGPGGGAETLGTYLYKQGFVSMNFGYAAAIAYTIAGMAAVLAALNLMLTRGKQA